MDILDLTAVELGERIRKRELSALEALEAVYGACRARDRNLNAYAAFEIDPARTAAQRAQALLDSGETLSPLAGVPVGIKDNINVRNCLTTCASKILRDYRAPFDASAVRKLRDAGVVPAGTLNMDEFAMGSTSETSCYGPVRNPWDTGHVPGGSSGGAAAAVAARECVCALGSDTGGSVRQPSAYCGVTGFKPSYGRVSRYGLIAYGSSLDQIGPLARDVRDCAALLDIIAGPDSMDATSVPFSDSGFLDALSGNIHGLRVGVPEECFGDGVEEDVRRCVEAFLDELKRAGAVLVPLRLPFIRYAVPVYYILATAEASSNLSRFDGVKYGLRAEQYNTMEELYTRSRSEGFGKEVQKRILLGTFVLSSGYYDAYYNKALKMKQMIVDGFAEAFGRCDVIALPVSPTTAPALGSSLSDPLKMYLSDIFTVPANLAGLPGLSVPCGFDRAGLPVGAQLFGAVGADSTVLNVGYAYQLATDWHKRRPRDSEEASNS
ncbi:MAG: Asp-tRNA(Asn)/Glu-tRNA(Gln) amidotransferase subunit GatA [Oscillibacter sp.]|nr:Asp-tRNA(Asn)/Glu-tRNA(Gln) amidotransferase subunit GatA [Oscillibacter sp.]